MVLMDAYVFQNKWAPLHIAVKHGHVSVIENLIKLGADVNACSTVSYSIAFHAYVRAYVHVCIQKFLHIVQDNWTPLLSAAKNGRTKVAETLIRLGADVHTGDMVGTIIECQYIPPHICTHCVG